MLKLKPVWTNKYSYEKKLTGTKTDLQVKRDISKNFEHTKELATDPWEKEIEISFGKKQKIYTPFQEGHNIILGTMTELLIYRKTKRKNLFILLKEANNKENNIYTDNERLLACMTDLRNKYDEYLEEYLEDYKNSFDQNQKLVEDIKNAFYKKKNVVHSIFGSLNFEKDLDEFLSESNTNRDLRTECVWNVTLFYIQITQEMYRPAINSYFSYLTQDVSNLHDNIDYYIKEYIGENDVIYEKTLNLSGQLTNEEMVHLKMKPNDNDVISIKGRSDIYNVTNNCLCEIKASKIEGCSQEWLIQTLIYGMILDVINLPVKKIIITNLLNGCLWEFIIKQLPKIEYVTHKKISKKFEWHRLQTHAFIRGIEKMRKEIETH